MSTQKAKISLSRLLSGKSQISNEAIALSNNRIKNLMKDKERDFQKKQQQSLVKASKMVLNA